MDSVSENTPAIASGWHKVVFAHEPHSWMIGEVKGDHLHVHDVVHHGTSDRKLLGESPDMHPIPVSHFVQKGAEFHPIHAPAENERRNEITNRSVNKS